MDAKNHYYIEIEDLIRDADQLESQIDGIQRFKSEKSAELSSLVMEKRIDFLQVMVELTLLAEAVLVKVYELARHEIQKNYGSPYFKSDSGEWLPSKFAMLGMGKLGGQELHFFSDLDLVFVYDFPGETRGKKTVSNQEYYAKLIQKIIYYLGTHNRFGAAYKVDTELRPSGSAGPLVTPLPSWIQYYGENAALWEKQALLKARLIDAEDDFSKDFSGLFPRLIFLDDFQKNFGDEIHRLRLRIETELAKEGPNHRNFKKGHGGILDIEFAVQYLQLKHGKAFPEILESNTLKAIQKLSDRRLISDEISLKFNSVYLFYRKLEFFLELRFNVKDPYLDLKAPYLAEISGLFDFNNEQGFIHHFEEMRRQTRRLYLQILDLGE